MSQRDPVPDQSGVGYMSRVVAADKQSGAMPTAVRGRPDADQFWAAFRRVHSLSWTGRDIKEFAFGWDARATLDEESAK